MSVILIILSVLVGLAIASMFPILLLPLFIFAFIGLCVLAFFVALPIFIIVCMAMIPIIIVAGILNSLFRRKKCSFSYKTYNYHHQQQQRRSGVIDGTVDEDDKQK